MKISVTTPILNECPWVAFSIMAALEHIHQFIYALDAKSNDGTRELLFHVKQKYAHEKLIIIDHPTFHPSDMKAYNEAFNVCIAKATGDAVWFLHPDMIVLNPVAIESMPESMAWYTNVTSYAGDFQTIITKGRCDKWKNIHARKLGVHYFGGYGSQNEDFYHSDITGKSYKHYGTKFSLYPFQVKNSGINVNHYCELKDYSRRLEKMKSCLRNQNPHVSEAWIEDAAIQHPRVTLEWSSKNFGDFEFTRSSDIKPPSVFEKYKDEFQQFVKTKEPCIG